MGRSCLVPREVEADTNRILMVDPNTTTQKVRTIMTTVDALIMTNGAEDEAFIQLTILRLHLLLNHNPGDALSTTVLSFSTQQHV